MYYNPNVEKKIKITKKKKMTWRVNFVRSKDAQKELARTSLSSSLSFVHCAMSLLLQRCLVWWVLVSMSPRSA